MTPTHSDSSESVAATAAALEVIDRLRAARGALALFGSGGCCEGSCPICLGADELAPGPGDVQLGALDGVPFYVDAEQYDRWGRPAFLIDVAPGAASGFSLEGTLDVHFVLRSRDPGADQRSTASS